MVNELNLTTGQTVILLIILSILFYFVVTVKVDTPKTPYQSDTGTLDRSEGDYTSLAYLERQGAYIQLQGRYYN